MVFIMNPMELLKGGRVGDALKELQRELRDKPDDTKLRIFLFQLNCVLGRYDKALTQLNLLADLNSETMLMAQIFRPVLACEILRGEVFAGKRTPLVLGEPLEWIGLLIRACGLVAQGEFDAAAELRNRALEAAPAGAGKINGEAFEWLADADSRLGPVFEVILDGKYYWLPVTRVKRMETEAPTDLRDLVWIPARFIWSNGGNSHAHIPTRYPATEKAEEDSLLLARKTDWQTRPGETSLGLGQRILATDQGDYPLLECRTIEMFN